MWFGTRQSLSNLPQCVRSIVIGDENIQPVESVRDLGVHFDSELTMKVHIAKTTQVCFYQLRRLQQIRRLLGREVTANLVVALVFSRLDYCNALLADLPYTTLRPLQRVINAAARLVYGLRPRDHVSAALIELRWLPIEARIKYKLCLLVHSALNDNAPAYITSLLQPIAGLQSRQMVTRSASNDELSVPRTKLKFGERAFKVAAPKAWNSLPIDIRSTDSRNLFKKKLKTFLLSNSFEQR